MLRVTALRPATTRLAAALICLGLGACAMVEVPARGTRSAPVPDRGVQSAVIGQPVPRPAAPAADATIRNRAVGVRVLDPPTATARQTVEVRPGDTVYGIARRTGVSADALARANDLPPPYLLTVGQRLIVPKPTNHIVRRGETLHGIAESYGVDVYALASANGLTRPYDVEVGQILAIPSQDIAGLTESEPATALTAAPSPRPPDPLPEPPAAKRGGFIWPLEGRILSGFGPKTNGLHNDGINIAASPGTPIRAVQSGVVAYAGNQLQGFGNMLLIKHESGWITAYAHAQTLLVERGDRVSRGQVVALVGSTGGVNQSQLHFELRKGKEAVDPLAHLPPLGT